MWSCRFRLGKISSGASSEVTAYFGEATKRAVNALQKRYELKPYPGHVGPITLKLLNSLRNLAK